MEKTGKITCIVLTGILFLLAILYYSDVEYLLYQWKKEDFNYCFLIPLIVAYMVWEKRDRVAAIPSTPSWTGFFMVGIGLTFYWLGELGGEYYTLFLSAWLVVVGLLWSVMGWEKLKTIWFPAVFSLAMFPFPNFINTRLILKLKLISSEIGVWIMQALGMSAYREGNIIDIGHTKLQVVDACSGLRYVFPLIILAFLLVYFFKPRFRTGVLLVLSAIPLSVIMNSLRIASTGLLYIHCDPAVAQGFFHGFSGFIIFMISLGLLWLEMLFLNHIFPPVSKSQTAAKVQKKEENILVKKGPPPKGKSFFSHTPLLASGLLILISVGIYQAVDFREHVPATQPFSQFPMKIGKWTGSRHTLEEKFIKSLDLSDYIMADYRDPNEKSINFYVAYYESQRKGESIHSPGTCLPGSGWVFKDEKEQKIPLPGYGGTIPVRYACMQKGGYRQVVYYWFVQRGRILTNAFQLKIYNFWDALTKHRTDGALIRVITPVYEGEDIQDARKRLNEFVALVVPKLKKFIPER